MSDGDWETREPGVLAYAECAWPALTGEPCPPTPADHDAYVEYGLPWFAVYDEPLGDGSSIRGGPGSRRSRPSRGPS